VQNQTVFLLEKKKKKKEEKGIRLIWCFIPGFGHYV